VVGYRVNLPYGRMCTSKDTAVQRGIVCCVVVFIKLPCSADHIQSLTNCAETPQQNYLASRTAKAQRAFIFNIPIFSKEKRHYKKFIKSV
jgi:hypothetical protein